MSITDKQFEDSLGAAGLCFIGKHMNDFLENPRLIDDLAERKIYARQLKDEGISDAMTKVDDICRIIREGRTIEALERVLKSEYVAKHDPESILSAKKCRIPLEIVLAEISHRYE
jgi:hypothetical protein